MTAAGRKFGFWASLGRLQFRDLVTLEFIFGIVAGVLGARWALTNTDVAARVGIAGDFLALAAALIGVVFAGFALVIALLSDSYLKLLGTVNEGVRAFLSPFIVAIGLQVGVVLGSVAYRASAVQLSKAVEHWWFGVLCVLFLVALLDVVTLARGVLMHGVARARSANLPDIAEAREQRRSGSGP